MAQAVPGIGRAVADSQPRPGTRVGVDDAELEVLIEERLRVGDAGFDVVDAVRVRDVGATPVLASERCCEIDSCCRSGAPRSAKGFLLG